MNRLGRPGHQARHPVPRACGDEPSPTLYRRLAASGDLDEFVMTRAEEISDAVGTMTQEQRLKEKWDKLGPVECAARLQTAASMNREVVLAEMLEFPTDD